MLYWGNTSMMETAVTSYSDRLEICQLPCLCLRNLTKHKRAKCTTNMLRLKLKTICRVQLIFLSLCCDNLISFWCLYHEL